MSDQLNIFEYLIHLHRDLEFLDGVDGHPSQRVHVQQVQTVGLVKCMRSYDVSDRDINVFMTSL